MKVKEIIKTCQSKWIPNDHYNSESPFVSVILPTFNRALNDCLKKSIDSVLAQSYQNLELIIIDDGSTDETYNLCMDYMKTDYRVHVIHHKYNIGIPAISEYEAYTKSRGRYIAYIFDDCTWERNAIKKTIALMEEKKIKASCGITRKFDPSTGRTNRVEVKNCSINETCWIGNRLGNSSVVLHKEVIESVGLYDPHLALICSCDWDLWARIADQYNFVTTGITFSTDYGLKQKDTIKNTYHLSQWCYLEHQQHRNKKLLFPEKFEEIDIVSSETDSSKKLLTEIASVYHSCKKKKWYSEEEFQKINNTEPTIKHIYGLLFCPAISASIMNFTRHENTHLTLGYTSPYQWSSNMLVQADFVVIVRDLSFKEIAEKCKKIYMPCYYYVDDNFRELEKAESGLARATTPENLAIYTGVIVSTLTLKEYYINNKLHNHVIVLPALWRECDTKKEKDDNDQITVGFMGGAFRGKTFLSYVYPALKILSSKEKIKLILPCSEDTVEEIISLETEGINVIPFFRTNNYELLLSSYQRMGTDILIHCGENIANNKYKTKNALLNAVTLGVPLIVSKIEPYSDFSDNSYDCYIVTENTVTGWTKALEVLMKSKDIRSKLVRNSTEYTKKNNSNNVVWKELKDEIAGIVPCSKDALLYRYEIITEEKEHLPVTLEDVRQFKPDELCYSGEIKGHRRYGITSPVTDIYEVGFLFAVFGNCSGVIEVSFYKKREKSPVCTVCINILDIQENNYTNVLLPEAIHIRKNEKIYVELFVNYKTKDGWIGLFEDKKRRTFVYKVFNKLHAPISGKNAIFIDCRS